MNCTNCNLQEKVNNVRAKLDEEILKNKIELLDKKIIGISQFLDELIIECIICKKRYELKDMQIENIFGLHSVFYYYGNDHLIFNLLEFIKAGLNNNELIIVSMEQDIYKQLLKELNKEDCKHNIKFASVRELINSYVNGGIKELTDTINVFVNESFEMGYKGIRWIGQPTFAMQETSKEDFLKWEKVLSEAFKGTKASLLCIYDAYDFMNKRIYIDDEVICESFGTHSHLLNDSSK